jgi:predicted flap endonuclease-1-like 5' DNA nuclease
MAKSKPKATDNATREIAAKRSRFYRALHEGYDKQDAWAIANGERVSAKPRPVKAEQNLPPVQASAETPTRVPRPVTPPAPPAAPPTPTTPVHATASGGGSSATSGDDLTQIHGIGSGVARKLAGVGVTKYEQIAKWSDDDVKAIDAKLGLRGRIKREDWVGQAQKITEGVE